MDGQRNNYRINDPNRRPIVDIRIPNYNTQEPIAYEGTEFSYL